MVEVSENRIVIRTPRDRNIQRDRTWRGFVAEENVRVGAVNLGGTGICLVSSPMKVGCLIANDIS